MALLKTPMSVSSKKTLRLFKCTGDYAQYVDTLAVIKKDGRLLPNEFNLTNLDGNFNYFLFARMTAYYCDRLF